MFETTAIYPNRVEDKKLVEETLHLNEEGDWLAKFYLNELLFAIGYNRVVYGDHGPYIEFHRNSVVAPLKSKYNNKIDFNNLPKNPKYFYWYLTVPLSKAKIYFQLKDVKYLPNAPKRDDGKPSKFNRREGYADYKVGMFYLSPFEKDLTMKYEYFKRIRR